jgi:hypothetical protein
MDPSSPWDYEIIAKSSMVEAEWKILNKQNPSGTFDKARKSVEKWIQISGKSGSTYAEDAEIDYWQVRWNLLSHHEAQQLLEKGLAKIEEGMKMSSGLPELYALRGRFELIRANLTSDLQLSARTKKDAKEDFNHALDLNSNLKEEYTKELQNFKKPSE